MEQIITNPYVDKGELLLSLDELEQALDQLTDQIEDKIQKKGTK
ncbi:hypothetical protein [Alkalibacillus almallahensis]|nr:hypothetical protein [Alkalibacillus almallahensis]NIK11031.1 hypothetical protein [Alkalibacillus almallahensis]